MKNVLHILNAANELDDYVDDLEKIFYDSQERISHKIPVEKIDVVVASNPHDVIPELGIGGRTYGPHLIFISLDPKKPNLHHIMKQKLEGTLAHETHHCARIYALGYNKNLFESLISEGLACHFDVEVTKNEPPPWCHAIPPKLIPTLFERAEKEYEVKKYNHAAWFYGSRELEIPRWTGYTLGYLLVEQYLHQHPGKTASTLFNSSAEVFK